MAGRLVLVCGTLLVSTVAVAHGEAKYQSTRDGKTLIWNSDAKPGDVATWSGDRDRNDYAKGFGRLIWFTLEPGNEKPQLYARYWGRMVNGKFEGPVNVHAKKQTHYAIFIDGTRVTRWEPGTAPLTATARWQTMVARKSRTKQGSGFAQTSNATSRQELASSDYRRTSEREREAEPEAPAAGPADLRTEDRRPMTASDDNIRDLYNERWPKIDIDESLRLLAFPPRTLRK